jgi:hypothetical protein
MASIASTKHVIYLSTNTSKSCEYCSKWGDSDQLDDMVNHYIQQHGCELLHVGNETTHDLDGKPWHSTVAMLASQIIPPPLEPMSFVVVPVKGEQDE